MKPRRLLQQLRHWVVWALRTSWSHIREGVDVFRRNRRSYVIFWSARAARKPERAENRREPNPARRITRRNPLRRRNSSAKFHRP